MKWCLVGKTGAGESAQAVPISSDRFTIGRHQTVSLQVQCPSVSKKHAELYQQEGSLYVRDLGSTNGTYVNGQQVESPAELRSGDLLQVAMVAFRVTQEHRTTSVATAAADACDEALLLTQLERVLAEKNVAPKYQPIVDLGTREILAYEVLGRSKLFGLTSPKIMFDLAARLDLEPQLSHLMRMEGVKQSIDGGSPHLFVNTHPREIEAGNLAQSLRALRTMAPKQAITIEIHEGATTDAGLMLEMRQMLEELDMSLAYDDFGVGQARLQEIAAAPPHFLKFDMSMIRGLDLAPMSRQHMVRSLVEMVSSMGVRTLAEGVETAEEHLACRQLGFELGQGFYYGRPTELSAPNEARL